MISIKKRALTITTILLITIYVSSSKSEAVLLNPSFEDGLNHWNVVAGVGGDTTTATTVSGFGSFTPQDGTQFLKLSMEGSGSDGAAYVVQTVNFTAGDTIGGWYGWTSDDTNSQSDPRGRISIRRTDNTLSPSEFAITFGNPLPTTPTTIPWTAWTHTIQTTFTYDVEYLIVEGQGWDGDSHAFFDASATPIPEPTTFLLLGIGIVGLAGAEVRRRRKKSS